AWSNRPVRPCRAGCKHHREWQEDMVVRLGIVERSKGGNRMGPIRLHMLLQGALSLLASVFAIALCAEPTMAQTERKPPATYPALPSEIPDKFTPTNDRFDYLKRDVMIPMRDGVRLHTVILIPKGAKRAPILLTRTPYDANKLTSHAESSH